DRAVEQVCGDLLNALVGPMRARSVRPGQCVAWRRRQALGPEDGRGIEHEVSPGAGVDRRGPMLRRLAAHPGGASRDDLESGDARGIAVVFPADQTGDAIA